MTGMQTDAQTAVIEELREVTVFPDWIRGEATEVYYDARVSGDDLWDLITRLAERFDVDFTGLNIRQYAPGEGAETIRPVAVLIAA